MCLRQRLWACSARSSLRRGFVSFGFSARLASRGAICLAKADDFQVAHELPGPGKDFSFSMDWSVLEKDIVEHPKARRREFCLREHFAAVPIDVVVRFRP